MELKILEIDEDYKIPYVDISDDFDFTIEYIKNIFTEKDGMYYTYLTVKCLDCDDIARSTGPKDYNTMIILLGSMRDSFFDMIKSNKIYIELFSDFHYYQKYYCIYHTNLILISEQNNFVLDKTLYNVPRYSDYYTSILRISSYDKNNLAKIKMLMENV